MIPHKVQNLVFDLGGVVIDIDPAASFSAMQALAAPQVTAQDQLAEHVQLFLDYEKGIITDETFREGIRAITQQPLLEDQRIDDAWCRMLLGVPAERITLLARLREQYRTFVLSNTNAIHVRAFNKIIEGVSGYPAIDHFFEKVYYSHLLKLRKPEVEIYRSVLADSGLRPEETLFLDDRPENIQAAQQVGMMTQLITPSHGILDVFAV